MLEIKKTREESKLLVALAGRLDTTTSPELEAQLTKELPGLTELVFDFQDLEYISSAGLRVLLYCQKMMNKQGTMKVVNVNDVISEIFEVTGFCDILTVE